MSKSSNDYYQNYIAELTLVFEEWHQYLSAYEMVNIIQITMSDVKTFFSAY